MAQVNWTYTDKVKEHFMNPKTSLWMKKPIKKMGRVLLGT